MHEGYSISHQQSGSQWLWFSLPGTTVSASSGHAPERSWTHLWWFQSKALLQLNSLHWWVTIQLWGLEGCSSTFHGWAVEKSFLNSVAKCVTLEMLSGLQRKIWPKIIKKHCQNKQYLDTWLLTMKAKFSKYYGEKNHREQEKWHL